MGFLGGGSGPRDDRGMYVYVRSDKTGEAIRVRIDPANDLVQEFEGAGDEVSHYVCHKDVMGNESFEIIRLDVEFDRRRRWRGWRRVAPPLAGRSERGGLLSCFRRCAQDPCGGAAAPGPAVAAG